jgi:hypothetical protein
MDAVLTTIVDGGQGICKITLVAAELKYAVILSIHRKPRHIALGPLLKRVPAPDWVDPLNLRCRGGGG